MHDPLSQLPKKIPTPRDQWIDDFRRGPLTVIVWGLAALISAWLLTQRHPSGELLGLATSSVSEIRTLNPGVVEEVLVDLYQTVEAGQIVAMLDGSEFDARLAMSRAKLGSLQTELRAAEIRQASATARGREWDADWREETRLRVEVLELEVILTEDRVEEQRLALQIERQKSLKENGAASSAELQDLESKHRRISRRITENDHLLAETGEALKAATLARQNLLASRPENAANSLELEAMRLTAQAERFRVQELELARRNLILTAPISGQVDRILAEPGQAVRAGEALLQLTSLQTDQVIVYVPESHQGEPQIARKVILSPQNAPKVRIESSIARLSPKVEMLPPRLWRAANAPEYGRPILLSPVPEWRQLAPGQVVTARFVP